MRKRKAGVEEHGAEEGGTKLLRCLGVQKLTKALYPNDLDLIVTTLQAKTPTDSIV